MEQRNRRRSRPERSPSRLVAPDHPKAAGSWAGSASGNLAKEGMRLRADASGAVLFVNYVGVKASRADRDASLGTLKSFWAAFEPSSRQKVGGSGARGTGAACCRRGWQQLHSPGRNGLRRRKNATLYVPFKTAPGAERKALMHASGAKCECYRAVWTRAWRAYANALGEHIGGNAGPVGAGP